MPMFVSLFSGTGTAGHQMNQAAVKEDVKSEEKDGEYSDNFEDEKSAEDEADTEDPPPRPLAPV